MKSTVINIDPDSKSYIVMVAGLILIVLGFAIMYDLIWQFFRMFLGIMMIIIGLFLLNYERNKFGFRFFKF